MRATKCPICGNHAFNTLFVKRLQTYKECPECGLVFIDPKPDQAGLKGLYNAGYFMEWGREEDYKSCKIHNFLRILSQNQIPVEPGGRKPGLNNSLEKALI